MFVSSAPNAPCIQPKQRTNSSLLTDRIPPKPRPGPRQPCCWRRRCAAGMRRLRAYFKNRPVRGPGLQGFRIWTICSRPRALTRRPPTILKHTLRLRARGFNVSTSNLERSTIHTHSANSTSAAPAPLRSSFPRSGRGVGKGLRRRKLIGRTRRGRPATSCDAGWRRGRARAKPARPCRR